MFDALTNIPVCFILGDTSATAPATQAAAEHGSTHDLLQIIGLCIVSATVLAYIARFLKQPLLLAYIIAGVIIGPIGLKWVRDDQRETVFGLAELGLAFLMFIVGLEINVKKLFATGKQATIITLVQATGCGFLGWAAARAIGIGGPGSPFPLAALYVGAVVAFSSTMIVVKLLSDRNELDTLPGRVTLGILLLQDVFAIVVLAIQPNLGALTGTDSSASAGGSPLALVAWSAVSGVGLVAGSILLSRFALPYLFRYVAMSPEVLLLSAITWCFVVCGVAVEMGFSAAMGALIAGVSVAQYPYSIEVIAKLRSLRDFFVTLFFVTLGMLLQLPTATMVYYALVFTAVVIVTRFLTVWPMVRAMGYGSRAGLLSSIHTSQISEFGLVIILIGTARFHHVGPDMVSVVVLLMVITSTLSTYMISFSHPIAGWMLRRTKSTDQEKTQEPQGDNGHGVPAKPIVLVGCFRVGSSLVHEFKAAGLDFSVIDFNPLVRDELKKLDVACLYGDISHLDTLRDAGVSHAKVLISTIPDDFLRGTNNLRVMQSIRKLNPDAKVILTAESIVQAVEFYQEGADYVILPRVLAARHLVEVVTTLAAGQTRKPKETYIRELRSRTEVIR